MRPASLAKWREEGLRFTEQDALAIAFDVALKLGWHEKPASHRPLTLHAITWDPKRRRASLLPAAEPDTCRGVAADLRELGLALVELLGGDPAEPDALQASPAFKAVLDGMLAGSPRGRPRSLEALRGELAGALAGLLPRRLFWRSRRVQGWAAAAASVLALAWSLYSGAIGPNRVLSLPFSVSALAFSPDGKRLAAVGEGKLTVWDALTWRSRVVELPSPAEARATTLAFGPDSGSVVVGRSDGAILAWDAGAAAFRELGRTKGAVASIAFSAGGEAVAACSNVPESGERVEGELSVLGSSGAAQWRTGLAEGGCSWVGWGPDGKRLFYRVHQPHGTALFESDERGSLKRQLSHELPSPLAKAALSSDGARFAALEPGSEAVILMDGHGRPSGKLNGEAHQNGGYRGFTPGAFSPDGRLFAAPYTAPGGSRRVRVWETRSWRLKREKVLKPRGVLNPIVREVAMSRKWLAAAFGNDFQTLIYLWDVAR